MSKEISGIQEAIERIQECSSPEAFDDTKCRLEAYMKKTGMGAECISELEKRAFYYVNEYSEKDTSRSIKEAKERVIQYIYEKMAKKPGENNLLSVLENYYYFLESLLEREPDKRGGIQKNHLDAIRIRNEYDVQFLLYAYLKPLYPEARLEVSEDTGYSTVRTDIYIEPDKVIEIKCSRENMKVKKLIEEIEADIIHYSVSNIYFFIYDKEKIIENPTVLKNHLEKKAKEKQVRIIIHQPRRL